MLNESVIKVLKNVMRDIAEHMQMVGDFLYIEGMPEDKNNVPFYEKHGFSVWRMVRQYRFIMVQVVERPMLHWAMRCGQPERIRV